LKQNYKIILSIFLLSLLTFITLLD